MNDDVRKAVLEPYTEWKPNLEEILEELGLERNQRSQHEQPDVLFLNGPAHSGKGFITEKLEEIGFDFAAISLPKLTYMAMQAAGLPDTQHEYETFKALPYGRDRIIAASESAKKTAGIEFNCELVAAHPKYQQGKLILWDNVGFPYELEFVKWHSNTWAGIRFIQVYTQRGFVDPIIVERIDGSAHWENDSRGPVDHDQVALFHNSTEALRVIASLVNHRAHGDGNRTGEWAERRNPELANMVDLYCSPRMNAKTIQERFIRD